VGTLLVKEVGAPPPNDEPAEAIYSDHPALNHTSNPSGLNELVDDRLQHYHADETQYEA